MLLEIDNPYRTCFTSSTKSKAQQLAQVYLQRGKPDSALLYLKRSKNLRMIRGGCGSDFWREGHYFAMMRAYDALGEYDSAIGVFAPYVFGNQYISPEIFFDVDGFELEDSARINAYIKVLAKAHPKDQIVQELLNFQTQIEMQFITTSGEVSDLCDGTFFGTKVRLSNATTFMPSEEQALHIETYKDYYQRSLPNTMLWRHFITNPSL